MKIDKKDVEKIVAEKMLKSSAQIVRDCNSIIQKLDPSQEWDKARKENLHRQYCDALTGAVMELIKRKK